MGCCSSRRAGLAAAVLLLAAGAAEASDAGLARYVSDGSSVFWFIQITDTHIDTVLPGEDEKLYWAVSEGVEVVGPAFVVNTGDLTDGTDGIIYGTSPHEAEWLKYGQILEQAGMTADFYYDLPGNHDAYGDGELEAYRRWSVQGRAHDTTQPSWTLDLPFGLYHFFAVATPANDGLQWPFDNNELTDSELAEAGAAFADHGAASLQLVFGHHDYRDTRRGDELSALLSQHGIGHYFHGHEHSLGERLDGDGVLRSRVDSLGQADHDNLVVWAVDADALSRGSTDARDPWPLVVITAPVDAHHDSDHALAAPLSPPVPGGCADAPLRALVFDVERPEEVRARVDGGAWTALQQRRDVPAQWRGAFDATGLGAGMHAIEVEARGSRARSAVSYVEVADGPCDLGDADEDPGPPNEPPVAVAGPDVGALAGAEVVLDGSASSDPDGELVGWRWDLGDGSEASGATVSHVYRAGGVYAVRLTVTDDRGAIAEDVLEIDVNEPPVARIELGTAEPSLDAPVELDGTPSSDPDGQVVAWHWDFGDGTEALGARASRLYSAPGDYTITLTVADDRGATSATALTLTLTVAPPPSAPEDAGVEEAGSAAPGRDAGGVPGAAGEVADGCGCGVARKGATWWAAGLRR